MDAIMSFYKLAMAAWGYLHSPEGANIVLGLFLLSEALGGVPAIKQNSVYQLVMNALGSIKKKLLPSK